MRTSYANPINFGDVLGAVTFLTRPQKIVEIGILDGFSLDVFCSSREVGAVVEAYDIFDDFSGNHADYGWLQEKFKGVAELTIAHGDFYEVFEKYENASIDLLHIDIANDGDIYSFAFGNYIPKLAPGGIMMLEGGSPERDQVEWMLKYDKPAVSPVLSEFSELYDIRVVGKMPSLTMVKRKVGVV